MSKHTNGNWGVEAPLGPDILTIVSNPESPVYDWIFVAQIGTDPVDGDNRSMAEHKANAQLMAAAPKLLSALRGLAMHCAGRLPISDIEGPEMQAAAEAIATAEGRS